MSRWQPGIIKRYSLRRDGKYKLCIKCRKERKVSKFSEYAYTTNQGKKSTRLESKCDDCCSLARASRFQRYKANRTPEQLKRDTEKQMRWAASRRKMSKRVPARKDCTQCGIKKLASQFYKNYRQSNGLNPACKVCCQLTNRVSNRKLVLRTKYGLTLDQYNEMIKSQGGKCAICRLLPALCVDHDHATGKIREILCSKCNLAVGNIFDNPTTAQNMAKYLIIHGVKP